MVVVMVVVVVVAASAAVVVVVVVSCGSIRMHPSGHLQVLQAD